MTNEANRPSSTTVRVLVVEDEWVVALDVCDCLEGLGYTVVATVASGEEAIAQARELRPDIVLMDIRLEGLIDGTEAGQQIWEELRIPIIYATGYSDKATVDRATATEPFGYILKPIKERDLYVALKTALQRYERESRLREEQQWAATILKAIGDGVIVVSLDCQVKYLNLVAEALTGWQLQEVMNRSLSEVFPLLDEQTQAPVANPITEALQTGTATYLVDPVLLVTRNGDRLPITDSAAPLRNEAGDITGAVMVFREVARRQPIQEQPFSLLRAKMLEQQMQEVQRLAQIKDDFLNTVSHELRSPLANIKMSIHLLEISLDRRVLSPPSATVDSQSQQVEKYLRILREQCDQELDLVNDLLELQRLEAERMPLELTSIEVLEWISQIAQAYKERARQRLQYLNVDLPAAALPPLISDLSILTRSVQELLANACKYTPPEETITVRVQQVDKRLQLMVSNSGVEISSGELPRIFDKFYRIPGGDRWSQGGSGLGLALVKKQITYLNGSIWAEQREGELSFIIELPLSA